MHLKPKVAGASAESGITISELSKYQSKVPDAGHGSGKPTAKIIEEAADSYAFIAKAMNATWQHSKA